MVNLFIDPLFFFTLGLFRLVGLPVVVLIVINIKVVDVLLKTRCLLFEPDDVYNLVKLAVF